MLKNKLEQISLLLVVLVEETAVAVVVLLEEHHHILIHVPIELQAVVKVSDDIYSHNALLLCCSLYKYTYLHAGYFSYAFILA
jgi:hypothetical protein